MQVNFNPNITFRSQTEPAQTEVQQQPALTQTEPDTFKKSGSVKEDIGKVAKFFTTLSEMTKASVKAMGYGAVTAVGFLAGGWLFGSLPRGFKKGNSLLDVFKHPIRNISTKAKVITGIATAAVAGYHIVKGKLKANQRTANVDHQLNIGHRTV